MADKLSRWLDQLEEDATSAELQRCFFLHKNSFADLVGFMNQVVTLLSVSHSVYRISEHGLGRSHLGLSSTVLMTDEVLDYLSNQAFRNGALLIRAYITFIVGRSDLLLERLTVLNKAEKNSCVAVAIQVLRSDEIRIIRNSLAHGTFMINQSEILFHDVDKEILIEIQELERICAGIQKILMWLFAASVEGSGLRPGAIN